MDEHFNSAQPKSAKKTLTFYAHSVLLWQQDMAQYALLAVYCMPSLILLAILFVNSIFNYSHIEKEMKTVFAYSFCCCLRARKCRKKFGFWKKEQFVVLWWH